MDVFVTPIKLLLLLLIHLEKGECSAFTKSESERKSPLREIWRSPTFV